MDPLVQTLFRGIVEDLIRGELNEIGEGFDANDVGVLTHNLEKGATMETDTLIEAIEAMMAAVNEAVDAYYQG